MNPHGQVLRLVNFFCLPSDPESPQTKLLPWSLLLEGWQTGSIGVRSGASVVKEFVDADDVARAIEILAHNPSPNRTVVAGPGARMNLRALVDASRRACSHAGRREVRASFGQEAGGSTWSMAPGWLVKHGWASNLSSDQMTEEMSRWLVEWESKNPHSASDRG
jgi:nucleoside-diphosphate-sugar epimerase